MRRKLIHNQSGITLVETVCASAILALSLATVLMNASQAFWYLANIRLTDRGSQVLQQEMETIRLMSWTSLQTLPSTFSDPSDTNHIYAGTITTNLYDSYNGVETVKRITLSISWTNRQNRVTTNTLTTLISNGGLNRYIY